MWILLMATAIAAPLPTEDLPWRPVNDTVMGGVSSSTVQVEDGTVRFSGELSLENNGGFTSMRAPLPPRALADAVALRVSVRGDGRTYDLTLGRRDVPLRAGSYRVPLATRAAGTTEFDVPLSAFRPTSFGRPVPGAPALDTDRAAINGIGLLLADKQPGPFEVTVLSIEVVETGPARAEDRAPVVEALVDAVEAGVAAYNAGDPARCRALYRRVLTDHHTHPALTPGERSLVAEALAIEASQRPDQAAWTLRQAIDSLLRG